MDYKKKYNDLLERARKLRDKNCDGCKMCMESLFDGLAESEDERIRKEILEFVTIVADSKSNKMEWISWLEKQGEDKKEINNFDVLPGLYKCVHRMFDGTPEGRLLFEVDNVYKCLSKHDRAEFEVSYGHSVYLEDPVVRKHFIPFEKQGEPKQEENDQKCEPFRIKKGEWYVCIHDFCNKGIKVGEIIQAEHDDTIRGIGFLYMENKYFRPAFENEKPQVDGFDAELNALLKKYEHLPKEELQEPLEFYLGVVCDDLDVVREGKPKWSDEDEELLQHCCGAVAAADYYTLEDKEEMEKWLKSLKQRIGGEK